MGRRKEEVLLEVTVKLNVMHPIKPETSVMGNRAFSTKKVRNVVPRALRVATATPAKKAGAARANGAGILGEDTHRAELAIRVDSLEPEP